MEMFRQIAPDGIVNKQIVDTIIPQEQTIDEPSNDGVKIAEEHNSLSDSKHRHDAAPEAVMAKSYSTITGLPADAYVPHQGTDQLGDSLQAHSSKPTSLPANTSAVETSQHDSMLVEESTSRSTDATSHPVIVETVDKSANTQTENSSAARIIDVASSRGASMPIDHSHAASTSPVGSGDVSDSSDKTWEKVEAPTEISEAMLVGDHPRDTENAVQPEAGQAVAAPANSEETRLTHEEMSRITPAQCPFLMNRE